MERDHFEYFEHLDLEDLEAETQREKAQLAAEQTIEHAINLAIKAGRMTVEEGIDYLLAYEEAFDAGQHIDDL